MALSGIYILLLLDLMLQGTTRIPHCPLLSPPNLLVFGPESRGRAGQAWGWGGLPQWHGEWDQTPPMALPFLLHTCSRQRS